MKSPIKCTIGRTPDGTWFAIAGLPLGRGRDSLTVQEIVNEAPIRREVTRRVMRQHGPIIRKAYDDFLAAREQYAGAQIAGDAYEIGFLGKLFSSAKDVVKRAVNNAKLTVKAIVNKEARKKLIKKLGDGVKKAGQIIKKVYEHPVFAGVVGVISATVPGAQPLGVTYALSRAAIIAAEKVAKGDPTAIADVAAIASQAASGHPGAQQVINEIGRQGTILASNPSMIPQALGEAALSYGKEKAAEYGKTFAAETSQYLKDRANLSLTLPQAAGPQSGVTMPW